MASELYLLDGMALIYRAHFGLIRSPIIDSKGRNNSALYGFCNTLLDILKKKPSHIALAMDTSEPTFRHETYPEYKAGRDAAPEDILAAIPNVVRLAQAFNVPVVTESGFEADDIIGTYARLATEAGGFHTFMITPDKDFAQLVSPSVTMLKPGRQGLGGEALDPAAVREQWSVKDPIHVADILALWGDTSDNIPGVPGIGEKTSKKLLLEYGDLETLLASTGDLKGKLKERLEEHADNARRWLELVTINQYVPVRTPLAELKLKPRDDVQLEAFFNEFEFNSIGKRLFGTTYKAPKVRKKKSNVQAGNATQGDLFSGFADAEQPAETATDENAAPDVPLKTLADFEHTYTVAADANSRAALIAELVDAPKFCFDLETDRLEKHGSTIVGIAFSTGPWTGTYVPIGSPEHSVTPETEAAILAEFEPVWNAAALKIGHNLKYDLGVLRWKGIEVAGPFFDTMVAHFIVEPELRHNMNALAESELGYTPIPITKLIGSGNTKKERDQQISMAEVPLKDAAEYATEDADITFQLHLALAPQLEQVGQENVFTEIEMPLLPVLTAMEYEGITLNPDMLAAFSETLAEQIVEEEEKVYELAGERFNIASPKQLGEVLYLKLQLVDRPKKTRTGQFATNEQTLKGLAQFPIVDHILRYRQASKLKSTYVDALPLQINPESKRVHTTFSQFGAATGRLASSDPNIQNIPVRTEQGQEIRKAFTARGPGWKILAADYSQIELRVMAEVSKDPGLREAFEQGHDIHAATAARVFDTPLKEVTAEQRRRAKMVNFGIMYGISAFGLGQRLSIPRKEAADIITAYFEKFSRVKQFMDRTIQRCETDGYVETLSGRRRRIRDINSRSTTVKKAAQRIAINSPIQGTAADMIKIAMNQVHRALEDGGYETRMLLQVHDELVFDLKVEEEKAIRKLLIKEMETTLPFEVPIRIDIGTGENWLEAH